MENNIELINPISQSDANNPKNKSKSVLVCIIICIIFAVSGIGFGVYELIQNQSKDKQISDLKVQVEDAEKTTVAENQKAENIEENEIASHTEYKNPIILSQSPTILTYSLQSDPTQLDKDIFYRLQLFVKDGEISCSISTSNNYNERWHSYDKDCEISGLSGKVYKPIKIGEGQDGIYDAIGFIMEDGSVEYFKQYQAFEDMEFRIAGKLKIDDFIVDAFQANISEEGSIGGAVTTVFMTSDGKTIKYDRDTML